jgi:5-(carboxyamino)imidazole ribonucleotide synthase
VRIGILGGGQLGRMIALAAYPLGIATRLFDPAPDSCGGQVTELHVGKYDDSEALKRFAVGLDAITYEFENVPVDVANLLKQHVPVFPPPGSLAVAQDRLVEKRFFRDHGVPTPDFAPIDGVQDLQEFAAQAGLPVVLKTRRMGYDGKGQIVVRSEGEIDGAVRELGGAGLIAEAFVSFERELSILAVRARDGAALFYPLVENRHRDGILRVSRAPAPEVDHELQSRAEQYASGVLHALDYVGVLAIEFFVADGRQLLANEMAPRVHNSGHWTIEGAETSQFENHARAVAGLPLGSTAARGTSIMLNLIGTTPPTPAILAVKSAHLHLYGKAPRAGRKLGHVTLRGDDMATLNPQFAEITRLIDGA